MRARRALRALVDLAISNRRRNEQEILGSYPHGHEVTRYDS